ncbi:MAG: RNA-binding S4 domain-containing protein [Oscillospiraceae bacterium]|nr:RNA-binding S4 domain-containing protein [Oscillospiraceae bacterium]
MKVKIDGVRSVRINGEYIKLDSLLKYTSIASTGGEAKHLINSGGVYVGKSVCTSRGKKIRPGDIIRIGESVILVK